MTLQTRSFQETLQSRCCRGFRFLFCALAFMGATCSLATVEKQTVCVFTRGESGEPVNPGTRATQVKIQGTFTQNPNVEISTLDVPGDGNCFFWSLLVALEVHKALQEGNEGVEKGISHDGVIEAREQFKVLGRALVDWHQANVRSLKHVRLTPDGQRAINRWFRAKGINENDTKRKKSIVEDCLGRLSQAYNDLSLEQRIAARKEHYRQVCTILNPGNHAKFFTDIYPKEKIFMSDNMPELRGMSKDQLNGLQIGGLTFPGVDACGVTDTKVDDGGFPVNVGELSVLQMEGPKVEKLTVNTFAFGGFEFKTFVDEYGISYRRLTLSGPEINSLELKQVAFEQVASSSIQWYHVNAIFADRTYFPTDLVDLCGGLEMCSDVNVCIIGSSDELAVSGERETHWSCVAKSRADDKPLVFIQIKDNHYQPDVRVLGNATTNVFCANDEYSATHDSQRLCKEAQEIIETKLGELEERETRRAIEISKTDQ